MLTNYIQGGYSYEEFKKQKAEFLRLLNIAEELFGDGVAPKEIATYIEEKRESKFTDPFLYGKYHSFLSNLSK